MAHRHTKQKPKSVGVVGDGDDVELLEDFEAVFAIAITDKEAESILTLGEAHEIICSKIPKNHEEQVKCLSAMAYYRLNRAIKAHGKIQPLERLELRAGTSPKVFQKHLENNSNLSLEFLTRISSWVVALFLLQFVTWIAATIVFSGMLSIIAGFLTFSFTHALWRIAEHRDRHVWAFDGTIADLSRRAAEVNFGKLVSLGGKWNETEVWRTMTSVIQSHTGFPQDQMTPKMQFI
ncbi:hypothetical protein ACOTTU_01650 [Roseobacter sp. EG26]|uniref:hypothetical protein n=1 Tax=Roseobacter sp. EG26 TaxID=3412477 RepID=UPI003CE4B401